MGLKKASSFLLLFFPEYWPWLAGFGLSCVGGLWDMEGYFEGMEPCTDTVVTAQYPVVAGYLPSSNVGPLSARCSVAARLRFAHTSILCPLSQVIDHCAIDLEQAAMDAKLGGKDEASFVEAQAIYQDRVDNGGGRTL